MKSAEVQQLEVLSDLFAESVGFCRPASVAILGVAGGNGLGRIDANITKRVVGLDINPSYLEVVRRRHSHIPVLELYCVDLAEDAVDFEPVQLVHVALVFEHAGVGRCLGNALSLVVPGGALSAVLQLPSEIEQPVGESPFPSIGSLKSHFSLIDPVSLCETFAGRKFRLKRQTRRPLPSGKGLWMGIFSQGDLEGFGADGERPCTGACSE